MKKKLVILSATVMLVVMLTLIITSCVKLPVGKTIISMWNKEESYEYNVYNMNDAKNKKELKEIEGTYVTTVKRVSNEEVTIGAVKLASKDINGSIIKNTLTIGGQKVKEEMAYLTTASQTLVSYIYDIKSGTKTTLDYRDGKKVIITKETKDKKPEKFSVAIPAFAKVPYTDNIALLAMVRSINYNLNNNVSLNIVNPIDFKVQSIMFKGYEMKNDGKKENNPTALIKELGKLDEVVEISLNQKMPPSTTLLIYSILKEYKGKVDDKEFKARNIIERFKEEERVYVLRSFSGTFETNEGKKETQKHKYKFDDK